MSTTYRKVEYTCECGHNYGSCGETGKFFLKYQGVSDHYILFFQEHPDVPPRRLLTMADEGLTALGKLINYSDNDLAVCSTEEIILINEL